MKEEDYERKLKLIQLKFENEKIILQKQIEYKNKVIDNYKLKEKEMDLRYKKLLDLFTNTNFDYFDNVLSDNHNNQSNNLFIKKIEEIFDEKNKEIILKKVEKIKDKTALFNSKLDNNVFNTNDTKSKSIFKNISINSVMNDRNKKENSSKKVIKNFNNNFNKYVDLSNENKENKNYFKRNNILSRNNIPKKKQIFLKNSNKNNIDLNKFDKSSIRRESLINCVKNNRQEKTLRRSYTPIKLPIKPNMNKSVNKIDNNDFNSNNNIDDFQEILKYKLKQLTLNLN